MKLPPHLQRYEIEFRATADLLVVDPYLLAAICDRESMGGLTLRPRGPSGVGDGGHGHGLMQIDGRYHRRFIDARGPDGLPLWTVPRWNILYGGELFARNLREWDGELYPAIATYNCSYAAAVRALRALPSDAPPAHRLAALDLVTTGADYVTDVLRRRETFLSLA